MTFLSLNLEIQCGFPHGLYSRLQTNQRCGNVNNFLVDFHLISEELKQTFLTWTSWRQGPHRLRQHHAASLFIIYFGYLAQFSDLQEDNRARGNTFIRFKHVTKVRVLSTWFELGFIFIDSLINKWKSLESRMKALHTCKDSAQFKIGGPRTLKVNMPKMSLMWWSRYRQGCCHDWLSSWTTFISPDNFGQTQRGEK